MLRRGPSGSSQLMSIAARADIPSGVINSTTTISRNLKSGVYEKRERYPKKIKLKNSPQTLNDLNHNLAVLTPIEKGVKHVWPFFLLLRVLTQPSTCNLPSFGRNLTNSPCPLSVWRHLCMAHIHQDFNQGFLQVLFCHCWVNSTLKQHTCCHSKHVVLSTPAQLSHYICLPLNWYFDISISLKVIFFHQISRQRHL